MTGQAWGAIQPPEEAYDGFVADLNKAISNCLPGDFWAALAVCRSCNASLCQHGLSAHISSMPKLPVAPSLSLDHIKQNMQKGPPCPACHAPLDEGCLTTAYFGRVSMLTFCALVEQVDPNAPIEGQRVFIYRPPASWEELLRTDPPGTAVMKMGRGMHPIGAMVRAIMDMSAQDPLPVRLVSREEAVLAYYGGGPAELQRNAAAIVAAGIEPPVVVQTVSPGAAAPPFEFTGASKLWAQLTAGKNLGIVCVFSEPAIHRRLGEWGQVYGVNVDVDKKGRVVVKGQGKKLKFTVTDLIEEAAGKGFTIDEVIFDKGFWDLTPDANVLLQRTGLRG